MALTTAQREALQLLAVCERQGRATTLPGYSRSAPVLLRLGLVEAVHTTREGYGYSWLGRYRLTAAGRAELADG